MKMTRFNDFLPAMECLKMSTINGGHYKLRISFVRAATADGYGRPVSEASYMRRKTHIRQPCPTLRFEYLDVPTDRRSQSMTAS